MIFSSSGARGTLSIISTILTLIAIIMPRIKALLVLMRYLSSTLGQVWFRDRCISSHRGRGEVLSAPVEDFIIKKI